MSNNVARSDRPGTVAEPNKKDRPLSEPVLYASNQTLLHPLPDVLKDSDRRVVGLIADRQPHRVHTRIDHRAAAAAAATAGNEWHSAATAAATSTATAAAEAELAASRVEQHLLYV